MESSLSGSQQHVRVNNNFSFWEKIITEVLQGSILGPLLFHIFINDLFLFVVSSYLSNKVDNKTLYAPGFNQEEVKNILPTDCDAVMRWFYESHVILSTGKYNPMCLRKDRANGTFIFKNLVTKNSKELKILQVTIDNKQTFKSDIKKVCQKVSKNRDIIKALKSFK